MSLCFSCFYILLLKTAYLIGYRDTSHCPFYIYTYTHINSKIRIPGVPNERQRLPLHVKTLTMAPGEPLECLPYRLHWFFLGEGCWGRREEAATLTPGSVVWGAWIVKLETLTRLFLAWTHCWLYAGLIRKAGPSGRGRFFLSLLFPTFGVTSAWNLTFYGVHFEVVAWRISRFK